MNSRRVSLLGLDHMVHFFEAEPASHTVLAIHGFGTSGRSFRHTAPFLNAQGVRIVAPDQLNFGDSEKPQAGYSLRLYAQLAVETCLACSLERPWLMGHSAGGKVAAATVGLYPDHFSGLILVNSGGFSVLAPVLLLADTPLFHLADTRFFRRHILRRFSIAETIEAPEQWEAFRRFQGDNAALDIDRSGLRTKVQSIRLPTAVIWGLKDRMIPAGTPRRIQRDIPHAKVIEMPDSGHSPMYNEPERFAGHVADFMFNA
jgi:pimeloyl-ACP methyl ester carboxylesterase